MCSSNGLTVTRDVWAYTTLANLLISKYDNVFFLSVLIDGLTIMLNITIIIVIIKRVWSTIVSRVMDPGRINRETSSLDRSEVLGTLSSHGGTAIMGRSLQRRCTQIMQMHLSVWLVFAPIKRILWIKGKERIGGRDHGGWHPIQVDVTWWWFKAHDSSDDDGSLMIETVLIALVIDRMVRSTSRLQDRRWHYLNCGRPKG